LPCTNADNRPRPTLVDVPGAGPCVLPHEFALFTGPLGAVQVCNAQEARASLAGLRARLAAGAAIVLTGPYAYVDAIYRYCQRFERQLVARHEFQHIADRARRSAAFADARRRKLHHLLLLAQGDSLLQVEDAPDTTGLQTWLEAPTGDAAFLIPVRRLQRILTDVRRAREGIHMPFLHGSITIFPHVYVPADQSVPAMFVEYRHLMEGGRVLDVGTGTGVLALLAAQAGAARVVATDSNPKAVANARANVQRLGLEDRIETRGPADLYESVPGETFDMILFNAPWIQGEPQTLYDTANYDPGYRVLDGFLQGARDHLAPRGVILLQYSDVSQRRAGGTEDEGVAHLERAVAANGLRIVGQRRITRISRVLGAREHVYLFEIRSHEDPHHA